MTVVEWCVPGVKDLRFIGIEFHKRGEELRNNRSANLSLLETVGRKRHRRSEERSSSAGRFDIYEPVKILWFGYMEKVVCNGDDLILNLLFNFEPMEGLEHWGDVRMFNHT